MAAKLSLSGGIALVTGAANGIGRETALAFAEAGAKGVIFADIDGKGAEQTSEDSKKHSKHPEYRALPATFDIANSQSVEDMVALAVKEFGRIDYAVNSAGIDLDAYKAFTPTFNIDSFSQATDINIKGAALFLRFVMAAMSQQEPVEYEGTGRNQGNSRSLGRGSIVLLGSISSLTTAPGMVSYTASKHAVIGLTKSAAVDALTLGAGVRVNAVLPSFTNTPMIEEGRKTNQSINVMIEKLTPLKRAADPEEVADCIVFLSSSLASFVNGTAFVVDSGQSLPFFPVITSLLQ